MTIRDDTDSHESLEIFETIELVQREFTSLEEEVNAKRQNERAMKTLKHSDKFSFWTGFFNYETFFAFFSFFQPRLSSLKIWRGGARFNAKTLCDKSESMRILQPEEELFLTMVRLKTVLMVHILAHCFGVSEAYVSHIVTSYVALMYQDLKDLCQLPSYTTVSDHISAGMKK